MQGKHAGSLSEGIGLAIIENTETVADALVCENYINQNQELSEEEKKQQIEEYLALHCEMEKCLYLTGGVTLKCTVGEKEVIFDPENHDVNIDGKPAIASTDCKLLEHRGCFGSCMGQTIKQNKLIPCNPKIAHGKWLESCSKMKVGDANAVNENSYLICTRFEGGKIYPVIVQEGRDENLYNLKKTFDELEFSSSGKRLLMILEIYGEYAYAMGYLVSDGDKLSAIKGFRGLDAQYVTVGIGDAVQGKEDFDWYKGALSNVGYDVSGIQTDDDLKKISIPIDICIEKYLIDLEKMEEDLKKNIYEVIVEKNESQGLKDKELQKKSEEMYRKIELTQNQYDALIIARYQAGKLGSDISDYIINNEKDKQKWTEAFAEISAVNGKELETRKDFESNLFFGIYDDLSEEYQNMPKEYYFDFSVFDSN